MIDFSNFQRHCGNPFRRSIVEEFCSLHAEVPVLAALSRRTYANLVADNSSVVVFGIWLLIYDIVIALNLAQGAEMRLRARLSAGNKDRACHTPNSNEVRRLERRIRIDLAV